MGNVCNVPVRSNHLIIKQDDSWETKAVHLRTVNEQCVVAICVNSTVWNGS